MKLLRTLITALAAVIVAGTMASAAPSFRAAFDIEPSEVSPSVEVSPEPTEVPEAEPTETPAPEPTETPSPSPSDDETSSPDGTVDDGDSAAPDFSACEGLTGLENAICRHEALLVIRPDNLGLANALEHLTVNLAKHTSEEGEEGTSEDGTTDETGMTDDGDAAGTVETAPCPGKSCEPHGHGNANGHGKANGHTKH